MFFLSMLYRSPEGSEVFRSRLPLRYGGWGPLYSPWGPKSDCKFESSYLGPAQNTQDSWYQEDSIPGGIISFASIFFQIIKHVNT